MDLKCVDPYLFLEMPSNLTSSIQCSDYFRLSRIHLYKYVNQDSIFIGHWCVPYVQKALFTKVGFYEIKMTRTWWTRYFHNRSKLPRDGC